MDSYEQEALNDGAGLVAGIDEAGRGPLAGPVVAAAVIFSSPWPVDYGINDSKTLTHKRRERLSCLIYKSAISVGVGLVWQDEIDRTNIHRASLVAMRNAVDSLGIIPDRLLVDGRFEIESKIKQSAIIKGDTLSVSIAAASIIAKTVRDRIMDAYSQLYPEYGFAGHKGYGSAAHMTAIEKYGPSPVHRMSYSPLSSLSL